MSHDPKSKDFDPYSAWLGIAPGDRPPSPEKLIGVSLGETDTDRIIKAGMARKRRLDRFVLSEHKNLADVISKEVADAVSLLLKRAESAPKPVEIPQAEVVGEAVAAEAVETPVQATVGVPVEIPPRTPPPLPAETELQRDIAATSADTVVLEPTKEEWRLDQTAQAAGLVVLAPAAAEPAQKRTGDAFYGFLHFLRRLALLPFRKLDSMFRAIAGEENDLIVWFLRVMAAAAFAVACFLFLPSLLSSRPVEEVIKITDNQTPGPVLPGDELPEIDYGSWLGISFWGEEISDEDAEMASDEETADGPVEQRTSKSEWTGTEPPEAIAPFGSGDAKAFQEQWARHLRLPVELTNSIGMKLVLIPPGEFMMGSPGAESSATTVDERPRHAVGISKPFYLGAREVTRAEYRRVVTSADLGLNTNPDLGEDAPVEFLSWGEAAVFCRRLSEQFDEKAAGRVYRLPREAEWEYACRSGTVTRHYAGDAPATVADAASADRANAWGLRGMLGRVPEWCEDWYGRLYYASSPANDPAGPLVGTYRVVRGGGQQVPDIRSASRHSDAPNKSLFGFRVVCEMSSMLLARTESAKPSASQEPRPESAAGLHASQPKQLQEHWAKALKIPQELVNFYGMRLVLIPPGEFTMGLPEFGSTARPDELPSHRVRITRPFYLGKCEVTRNEYNTVLPTEYPGRYLASEAVLPVVRVRWSRAVRFCERLSEQPVEKAAGRVYRLPTEAEWEYACRLGAVQGMSVATRPEIGDSTFRRRRVGDPFDTFGQTSASLSDFAWIDENSSSQSHAVGQKLPNALDLYDMFGNVWELCADWYASDYYLRSPVDDPQGPESSTGKQKIKVLRGGAYMRIPGEPCSGLAPSHRGGIDVNMAKDFVGFRVAVTLASIPDEAIAAAAKSIPTGTRVGDDAIGRQNPMGPQPGDGPFRPPLEDVAAALPATNTVSGTTWVGKDSQGKSWEFHFQASGALHHKLNGSSSTNGTWKQDGNTIYMEANKKYAEFQGLIRGDRMEGKAWNVKGLRWTWTADKK